jgi:hypothetical protein
LYWFEQFCSFAFRLFSSCFVLFPLEFLCLFLLGFGSLVRCRLRLELGNLFLGRASFFLNFKTNLRVRKVPGTKCKEVFEAERYGSFLCHIGHAEYRPETYIFHAKSLEGNTSRSVQVLYSLMDEGSEVKGY